MKNKWILFGLIALLFLSSALSGCSQTSEAAEILTNSDINSDSENTAPSLENVADLSDLNTSPAIYADGDLDSSYDESSATKITLADGATSITGSGASAKDNTITITSAGTYIISGTLSNGQLIVDAEQVDLVQLVLDDAQIENSSGSPIVLSQSDKVVITLAPGSVNIVSDGQNYSLNGEDDPDAAIYAHDDLTINGSGSLTVNGNYMHGIKSTDNLIITEGTLIISSIGDGLRGNDSVSIYGGDLIIDSGCDGIKSSDDEDESSGWISIDGGRIAITSQDKGIQAESALFVSDGTIEIFSSDDSLHSNGSILISGGEITAYAGDDGAHADGSFNVTGGTISVVDSYEGLEGSDVTILGGFIYISADDDGINAAGGTDDAPDSADHFNDTGDHFIAIHGGYVNVLSNGDGIDSNGSIEMTGGTLIVSCEGSGPDTAIDCDNNNFTVSGGTLIASGSIQMLSLPTQATQPVITIIFDSVQLSDELLTLSDSESIDLMSVNAPKDYQYMMISNSKLVQGETYTLSYGGVYVGESNDGILYVNGLLSDESSEATITLDDTVLSIAPDGSDVDFTAQMPGSKGGGKTPGSRDSKAAPSDTQQ